MKWDFEMKEGGGGEMSTARQGIVYYFSATHIFSRDLTYLIARGPGLLERFLHFPTFQW